MCRRRHNEKDTAFELQKGCQVVTGATALNWVVSRNTEILVGEKRIGRKW